jgi:hypothetical protein
MKAAPMFENRVISSLKTELGLVTLDCPCIQKKLTIFVYPQELDR